jgi:V-type H+-transporting ATPase subunit C
LNTETLLTVMVAVPQALENEFVKTYDSVGSDIAAYGGPDWTNTMPGRNDGNFGAAVPRASKKGSPVVPGSHVKVCQEGEYVLYSIVVLRGQYEAGKFEGDTFVPGNCVDYVEPLKHAFREKRFIVREFVYDAAKSGGLDGLIAAATAEVQQVHQTIVRWCQAHYGEAYSGWIHLKVSYTPLLPPLPHPALSVKHLTRSPLPLSQVVRGFIESVLRYGLPLDFLPVFLEPNMKREKALKVRLFLPDTISRPPRLRSLFDVSRLPPAFSSLPPCVIVLAGCVD